MKKYSFLLILVVFVAVIYGCGSGGGASFIPKTNQEIINKTEKVSEDGTLPEIVFSSGAKVKASESQTFNSKVEVTVTEEKVTESNSINNGFIAGTYIYRISAKLPSDNPLESPVSVSTVNKPFTITIPNNISDTGICYLGVRENQFDSWRYTRITDTNSNLRKSYIPIRASSQTAPKEVTFQLYKANAEFALFVLDTNSSKASVDVAESETKKIIYTKEDCYAQDFKVSTILKGIDLNRLKAEDLAVKVTFNSDAPNLSTFKANGNKYTLNSVSNEGSTGGKYSYNFDITGITFESQLDSEIKFNFALNTKGLKIDEVPSNFLIDVYSVENKNITNTSSRCSVRASEGDSGSGDDGGDVIPFSYPQTLGASPQAVTETYNIRYTLNGGTVSPSNPTSYDESSDDITLNNPTKQYYDFIGWTGSNGSTPELTVTIPSGSSDDKSYTANYELTEYDIIYNLDGGSVDGNPDTYNYNTTSFTLKNPTKSYYNFKGWSGTGLTGDSNTNVRVRKNSSGDREYTAHYTPISYTISYSLNDGYVTASNPGNYDVTSATITLNNPIKTNYDFTGWSGTDLTGNNNMTVSISQGSHGDRSYTAYYKPTSYTISYNLDGGTVSSANPTSYDVTSSTITLNNPTKDYYTFKGWTGSNGSTPQPTVTILNGSSGNKNYTANYTPISYTITYTVNGGTVSPANPTKYDTTSATITLNNPTRTGYTFDGWTGSNGSTPQLTVTIPNGSNGDKNYTANYTPIPYTISYTLNGGTVSPDNPTSYDITSSTITLNNPTKDYYDFIGWTGSNGDTPQMTTTIPQGSIENKNYTANFIPHSYSINYVGVFDGVVTPANPTHYDITSATINLSNPDRRGYHFDGWSGTDLTGNDNTNVTIQPGYPPNQHGDRTYEANYTLIIYNITYELDDGGHFEVDYPVTYDVTSSTFVLPQPVRKGYTFVGWSGTELSGDDNMVVTITPSNLSDPLGHRNYIAHWVLAPVVVEIPDSDITIEFKPVPAGTFVMGSPTNEFGRNDDETQHNITISKDIYVSTYEITQSQYTDLMRVVNPSNHEGLNLPVENVSWADAIEFCKKLNAVVASDTLPDGYYFNLPTEAQWEYACRAGTTTMLNNGTNFTSNNAETRIHSIGWCQSNANGETHEIGLTTANAWGLYDMHGNVSEWCRDLYTETYYNDSGNCTDPKGPDKDLTNNTVYRVIRGGSYQLEPKSCRSAKRNKTNISSNDVGFRVFLVPAGN